MRAIGFSTSTGMPRCEKRQRDLAVQLGRHGDDDRVDAAEQLAVVGAARSCRRRRGDLRGPLLIGVDDRDERRRPASVDRIRA